jgi:hypothetical protein
MSGEGVLPAPTQVASDFEAGRAAERADTLAYLARRSANATLMARQKPALDEYAADRRRQLEIVINDIEAGLHVGEVHVAGAIAGAAQETN